MYFYSMTCSKKDGTRREFLPYLDNGVPCVKDSVTGAIFHNSVPSSPFTVCTPENAVVSERSDAIDLQAALSPLAVAELNGVAGSVGRIVVSFGAASTSRELWFCWDDADKDDAFGAWSNNKRLVFRRSLRTLYAIALLTRKRLWHFEQVTIGSGVTVSVSSSVAQPSPSRRPSASSGLISRPS